MRLRDLLIDIEPLRAGRDFRAAFIARTVSLFGLGIATVALAAQVYRLTGTTVHVAAVSMVMSVSVLVGSLVGGVLADRSDRRRVIIIARSAAALGFAALAVNAMLPEPRLWAVYLCVAWDGLASGVSVTTLMAVVPTLVRRDQLPAAGALMAITGELGSIFAPFLGGVLIAAWGAGFAFAATAVTTALTSLLLTRLRPLPPARSTDGGDGGDGEGDGHDESGSPMAALRFALRERVVGGLLLLGGVTAFFGVPVVLFPELVHTRFGGGDVMLGLLYTAPAVGSVLVSVGSGWIGRTAAPGKVLLAAVLVSGLAVAGFGLSPSVGPALAALVVVGAAGTVYGILEYALVHHSTPDRLRGRMAGVLTSQQTTGDIAGDAEVALIARWFNPGAAAVFNGLLTAVTAVVVAVAVPGLRRATLPAEDDADADDTGADGTGTGADGGPGTPSVPLGTGPAPVAAPPRAPAAG
ncbi:enterobactin transporter EntS [Kitasatospora sp. NPDC056327]|uniref:enterobactin transporter EntS n=1 Tax=Kitasatospora sp. NPDC056327 TaxID=3345785 RepID=UPI0035DC3A8B